MTVLLIDKLMCCHNKAIGLILKVYLVHLLALVVTFLPHATNICCSVGSVHMNILSSAALWKYRAHLHIHMLLY